jgi:hypothetical protein
LEYFESVLDARRRWVRWCSFTAAKRRSLRDRAYRLARDWQATGLSEVQADLDVALEQIPECDSQEIIDAAIDCRAPAFEFDREVDAPDAVCRMPVRARSRARRPRRRRALCRRSSGADPPADDDPAPCPEIRRRRGRWPR